MTCIYAYTHTHTPTTVAANVCLRDHGAHVQRILIVDLDVHQGNGNAVLFRGNDRVFTFSMHCSGNYFSEKQESDLDVEVPPGAGDEAYLTLLSQHLPRLFEQEARRPDLVFYQAGVDVLASDRLGRLELTREGVRRRNEMVYEAVARAGARLVVTVRV
jgi:acetoin utilization deacetylase AcuC-like enzyme